MAAPPTTRTTCRPGYYCTTSPTRLTLPATSLVADRGDQARWIDVRRTQFAAETWDTFVNCSNPTIQLVTQNDTIPMSEDEAEQFIASVRFQLDQLSSYWA